MSRNGKKRRGRLLFTDCSIQCCEINRYMVSFYLLSPLIDSSLPHLRSKSAEENKSEKKAKETEKKTCTRLEILICWYRRELASSIPTEVQQVNPLKAQQHYRKLRYPRLWDHTLFSQRTPFEGSLRNSLRTETVDQLNITRKDMLEGKICQVRLDGVAGQMTQRVNHHETTSADHLLKASSWSGSLFCFPYGNNNPNIGMIPVDFSRSGGESK